MTRKVSKCRVKSVESSIGHWLAGAQTNVAPALQLLLRKEPYDTDLGAALSYPTRAVDRLLYCHAYYTNSILHHPV